MAKNPLMNLAKLKDLLPVQNMVQQIEAFDEAKADADHQHIIDDIAELRTELDGKAPTAHSHSIADVATLAAQLQSIPVVRHNGSVIAEPKIFTASKAISGAAGAVVFDMVDGAGAALIGTLRYAKAEISENTISYNYAYALSPDKKQLTVTVYRLQSVTLLGIQVLTTAIAAPAGTVVNLLAIA